jgi:hypothetical protein
VTIPQDRNLRWSLDFVADTLVSGRRFRILTLVDDFTRECLGLVVDTSLTGLRVARKLDRIAELRSYMRYTEPPPARLLRRGCRFAKPTSLTKLPLDCDGKRYTLDISLEGRSCLQCHPIERLIVALSGGSPSWDLVSKTRQKDGCEMRRTSVSQTTMRSGTGLQR